MKNQKKTLLKITYLMSLCGLFYFTAFYFVDESRISFTEDIALTFSVAKLILNGEYVLLGPPSHAGGRHLGPIYYYYSTFGLFLGRMDLVSTFQVLSILKFLAVLFCIYATKFILSEDSNFIAKLSAVLVVVSGSFMLILREAWHANFLIIPSSITFFAAFLCIEKGWRYFSFLLLSASLLLQGHFLSAPAILGIGLATLALLFFKHSFSKAALASPPSTSYFVLTLLSWLPLLAYEIKFPGNLKQLFLVHSQSKPQARTLNECIETVGKFFKETLIGGYDFSELFFFFGDFGAKFYGVIVAIVFLCLLKENPKARPYLILFFSSVLPYAFALRSIPDWPQYRYLLTAVFPVTIYLSALLIGQAFRMLKEDRSIIVKAISSSALILFLLTQSQALLTNIERFAAIPKYEFYTLKHAREIAELIEADRGGEKDIKILGGAAAINSLNSYYYHLDGNYLRYMQYGEVFKELPSFHIKREEMKKQFEAKKPQAKLAYLVLCPVPAKATIEKIFQNFEVHGWEYEKMISLSGCETCARCQLEKFRVTEESN